ncbi:MAG: pentapeptide repeat-containing protein, partial [Rhodospirillaceae bacterium]|nr:pentapeptide repeat-containing protein [Rhodospirillaceae bacterium]
MMKKNELLIASKISHYSRSIGALMAIVGIAVAVSSCGTVEEITRVYQKGSFNTENPGKSCPQCDLRYEDFSEMDMSDGNFKGSYLFNVKFNRGNLTGTSFESATLVYVDFVRAD